MTNEQLTAYLQDESYLYSVGYEELKTLVMQYPYSANLRVLLLKKSYLDQNKDYDRNLQMSATYTTNRKQLYKAVQKLRTLKPVPHNVLQTEDYLELTELSNIERILADKQLIEIPTMPLNEAFAVSDWHLDIDDIVVQEDLRKTEKLDLLHLSDSQAEDDFIVEEELKKMAGDGKIFYPSFNPVEELTITPHDFSIANDKESTEDVKKRKVQLEITNKTSAPIVASSELNTTVQTHQTFTEWLSQFRMTHIQTLNEEDKTSEKKKEVLDNQLITSSPLVSEVIRKSSRKSMGALFESPNDVPDNLFGLADETQPLNFDEDDEDEVFSDDLIPSKKKKKLRPMHQLAAQSLVQDNDLLSETLADLLASQGNIQKAIEMYRKLILRFPEKNRYFATKIEKISN